MLCTYSGRDRLSGVSSGPFKMKLDAFLQRGEARFPSLSSNNKPQKPTFKSSLFTHTTKFDIESVHSVPIIFSTHLNPFQISVWSLGCLPVGIQAAGLHKIIGFLLGLGFAQYLMHWIASLPHRSPSNESIINLSLQSEV